jgi:hypothetical protein
MILTEFFFVLFFIELSKMKERKAEVKVKEEGKAH